PVAEVSSAPAAQVVSDANFPRRVPVPVLRPPLAWSKPTGVTLGKGDTVLLMSDKGGVGKSLQARLEKRGVTVVALEAGDMGQQVEAAGAISGVYWLPALDSQPDLAELDLAQWRERTQVLVKDLFMVMHAIATSEPEAMPFLVSGTRLGGFHGYTAVGNNNPLGGAVSGFTKAYKREAPDALVKVIDFPESRKTAALADLLIEETVSDPGIVEVGYDDDETRYGISFEVQPLPAGTGQKLTRETVFVITGAAGGITSAITTDLAQASGGIFYLLDLTPEPDPTDPHIAQFRQNADDLQQVLIDEARARGERPKPVEIKQEIGQIERRAAALDAIEAVQKAGGTAVYRSVNLLDGPALTSVVDEIREKHGRVDILVHAGGIEISKALADKPAEQFALVFDIKADGMFSLLKAIGDMPLGATVVFSSVAGRFGNSGQTDYSAANDLLCKLTSYLRHTRPNTQAIAVDWTAWGGIGMATRGSIPAIMKAAGIDMLPPEIGIPVVRQELTSGYAGELVMAGSLGMMAAPFDETGGLDVDLVNDWLRSQETPLLMVGGVKGYDLLEGWQVETSLNPNHQPFLYDHAMDGTPLLPGVMGTETFAQLATVATPANYVVQAVQNEQFLNPFKFYRMEPQMLYLSLQMVVQADGSLLGQGKLRSVRELAQPGLPPQEKVHFTAEVV
ncbi:MAG: SDR family NAD(P)-dependent oxidoreductase, partial [Anaerolineales bacterium]|nr:SDR family NAD(P)-dependent oxidoreductase [Anaerolineales bacterium]